MQSFWLRITTLPSRIRDSITLALPGRNWPFLFVRRSRTPPWEVNIPVASIPTFKAFPADIDRLWDTVLWDTLSYFFHEPRLPLAPWYHSRTPFTTYRTPLGNVKERYLRCISIDDIVIGNQENEIDDACTSFVWMEENGTICMLKRIVFVCDYNRNNRITRRVKLNKEKSYLSFIICFDSCFINLSCIVIVIGLIGKYFEKIPLCIVTKGHYFSTSYVLILWFLIRSGTAFLLLQSFQLMFDH